MPTLREIRHRVIGVRNTQKITRAMKMVAAAKLRRVQESLLAIRPYARKMDSLLQHVVAKVDPSVHPLLSQREIKKRLLIIISGDRGMCGAFNGNIIKSSTDYLNMNDPERGKNPGSIKIMAVGKKVSDFLSKRGLEIYAKYAGIFSNLDFGHARAMAQKITEDYLKGEFDRVDVVYNEFKSVMQQKVVFEQILPIQPEKIVRTADLSTHSQVDYIYEPSAREIADVLLPMHLNFQIWRILLESSTAEEGARMTAMNNATENAHELISDLTLSYNKARQASITKELLEIVSGAEALKKAG
jgi:F-type H+-transporting ATPase subunit gamma